MERIEITLTCFAIAEGKGDPLVDLSLWEGERRSKELDKRGFPGGSVVKTLRFQSRGRGVQSLVRELGSCMPSGWKKRKSLTQVRKTLINPIKIKSVTGTSWPRISGSQLGKEMLAHSDHFHFLLRHHAMSGDIFCCQNKGERVLLLINSGWRPETLLNILQCTGRLPPQGKNHLTQNTEGTERNSGWARKGSPYISHLQAKVSGKNHFMSPSLTFLLCIMIENSGTYFIG